MEQTRRRRPLLHPVPRECLPELKQNNNRLFNSVVCTIALTLLLLLHQSSLPTATTHAAANAPTSPGRPFPTAIVHVGPRKTGSSAIQSTIRQRPYRDSLAKDNYIIPVLQGHKLRRCISHRVGTQTANDPPCDHEKYGDAVKKFAKTLTEQKMNVIFSCESLDRFNTTAEFDGLDRLLGGYNIHIFVTYRRFFDFLHSLFGQQYRGGYVNRFWDSWDYRGGRGPDIKVNCTNIVTWLATSGVDANYYHGFYSTLIYRNYRQRYGEDHVTFLNMHSGNRNVVENFLCDDALRAPHACEKKKVEKIPPEISNKAIPGEYDEIAMAALDAGILDRNAISRPDAREAVRWRLENNLNLTVNDFTRVCPPQATLERILELSLNAEREFFPSFFESPSGESSLRSDFQANVKSLFCALDTAKVLSDPSWRGFFLSLGSASNTTSSVE